MLTVTNEGAAALLGAMIGYGSPSDPYVHLMGTAGTPLHSWTESNFAALELALSGGYAPIQLPSPGGDWTPGSVSAGAQATTIVLTWTFTAALTVYGWWFSDSTKTVSWFGDVFTPSYTFPAGGGTFTFQLPLQLLSCPGLASC